MTETAKAKTFESRRLSDSLHVPFVIRAWWLREFEAIEEVEWNNDVVAPTLWSSYSDPMCDLGGIGDFDEI